MDMLKISNNNYLIYRNTPWDKKVLGCNTNEIIKIVYTSEKKLCKIIENFEELCLNNKVIFSNIRLSPEDLILRKVLLKYNFMNVETSLLVECGPKNLKSLKHLSRLKFLVRYIENRDIEELQSIAFNIFHYGRFFEDPYINQEIARTRNKNWINDLTKTSKILIGEINKNIFGFMAFNVEYNGIILLLGGVKSDATIYAYPFWDKILTELKNQYDFRNISAVISANNLSILNLYSFFGFKFSQSFFGYHKHRDLK